MYEITLLFCETFALVFHFGTWGAAQKFETYTRVRELLVDTICGLCKTQDIMRGKTEYDPKYCDMIVKQAKNGRCMKAISTSLGFCNSQFIAWTKQHPEFKVAYKLARDCYEACLVQLIFENLHKPTFNARAAELLLVKICGVDWRAGIRMAKKDIVAAASEVMERCDMSPDERDRYLSAVERFTKIVDNTVVKDGMNTLLDHFELKNKTKIKVTGG